MRRAAFDIGSGATKLVVADVSGSTIFETLYAQEVPVGFALDWKKSEDNSLSVEIQAKGLQVLREFLAVCEKFEVPLGARAAVATEVFRKSSNGAAYLARVLDELGLAVEVVSQAVEAELGFRTAVALQDGSPDDVLCWDSGGASFQITARGGGGGDVALRSWLGSLGSGNATALLVQQVQGRPFATTPTPNPVSTEEAARLIDCMALELSAPAAWLRGGRVTAIGGPNSMFCVAAEACGKEVFTQADVEGVLASVVGQSDDDLKARAFCQGELKEPPGLIVPKICLLLCVMKHCGFADVRFCAAVGSCPGILISDSYFAASD